MTARLATSREELGVTRTQNSASAYLAISRGVMSAPVPEPAQRARHVSALRARASAAASDPGMYRQPQRLRFLQCRRRQRMLSSLKKRVNLRRARGASVSMLHACAGRIAVLDFWMAAVLLPLLSMMIRNRPVTLSHRCHHQWVAKHKISVQLRGQCPCMLSAGLKSFGEGLRNLTSKMRWSNESWRRSSEQQLSGSVPRRPSSERCRKRPTVTCASSASKRSRRRKSALAGTRPGAATWKTGRSGGRSNSSKRRSVQNTWRSVAGKAAQTRSS
mmetsp:Transcript_50142/g.126385  ORF Transcript_50142/g.126385 Transcript_50142/m.126385 type:complete len:274 (+) Transcript_50142:1081-1902(+)